MCVKGRWLEKREKVDDYIGGLKGGGGEQII